jgi:hypothetical protein
MFVRKNTHVRATMSQCQKTARSRGSSFMPVDKQGRLEDRWAQGAIPGRAVDQEQKRGGPISDREVTRRTRRVRESQTFHNGSHMICL